MKIPKREYTVEFKALAVKRAKEGQSIGAVAKDLGLIEQTLRNWVRRQRQASSTVREPRWSRRSRWSSPAPRGERAAQAGV